MCVIAWKGLMVYPYIATTVFGNIYLSLVMLTIIEKLLLSNGWLKMPQDSDVSDQNPHIYHKNIHGTEKNR